MLWKEAHFPGIDAKTGARLVQVIQAGNPDGLLKEAGALHPKIRQYVAKLKPAKGKTYLLVVALGAGEYYSSNINGDNFPVAALAHEGDDYGYRTFLQGHVFRHHQNKDAKISFGTIPLSVWNDEMKRVELILAIDRAAAKKHGAQDVLDKIDAGIPLSVSMGCRVNYDVCSICGNKAKTRPEYCTHLSNEMNLIYPDGRKVCAINPFPRFFDLSFVFVGADKIAKSLVKIASEGCCNVCEQMTKSTGQDVSCTVKTAAVKTSKQQKLSDIFKSVPSNFINRSVPSLEDSEPDLPRNVLDNLGSNYPLNEVLGTTGCMGMVLKPREYQRIILIRISMRPLADEMDEKRLVFPPSPDVDTSIPASGFNANMFHRLVPFLKQRSGFGPILQQRMLKIFVAQPKVAGVQKYSTKGFLSKLGAGYNGYRLQLLSDMPHELPSVLDNHPELVEALFQDRFLDMFSKEASTETNITPLVPLLGIFPVLYMLSAHWREQELHGERLNFLKKWVVEHPGLSSLLLAGALAQARGQKLSV